MMSTPTPSTPPTEAQAYAHLTPEARYRTRLWTQDHEWHADEPPSQNGTHTAPNPFELLLSALGACTAITLRMYLEHKQLPPLEVFVELDLYREGARSRIVRNIRVVGPVSAELEPKLLKIANTCPTHRVLTGEVLIETEIHAKG